MKRTIIFSILFILFALVFGFLVWAFTPSQPTTIALGALKSDNQVIVDSYANWTVFKASTDTPQVGFIFYPGGHVDYQAYSPLLRPIAAQGYLVVLVHMPLSLAVIAPERAADVQASFPKIKTWAIGGHSLGGAMAAHYVFKYPDRVQGLALWAAYPASSEGISSTAVRVLSIYASRDGLATGEKIQASRALLPADTRWVSIEGGNHAQFGSYGAQSGDNPAVIPPDQQQELTVSATLDLLASLKK